MRIRRNLLEIFAKDIVRIAQQLAVLEGPRCILAGTGVAEKVAATLGAEVKVLSV